LKLNQHLMLVVRVRKYLSIGVDIAKLSLGAR
jgi:hypothetical protein